MDNLDEGTPTQNAVWREYTLFYNYVAKTVVVQQRLTSQVFSVSRERATEMLQKGALLSIKDQQFYDEILKLYKLNEGDQNGRTDRGDPL